MYLYFHYYILSSVSCLPLLLQLVYKLEADKDMTCFESTEKSQAVVCFHKVLLSLSWLVDAAEG